jgi:hypothetical protein
MTEPLELYSISVSDRRGRAWTIWVPRTLIEDGWRVEHPAEQFTHSAAQRWVEHHVLTFADLAQKLVESGRETPPNIMIRALDWHQRSVV